MDQFFDLRRGISYHFLHCFRIAEPVACHHSVVDMFFKVIDLEVGHRRYASLGESGVGLIECGFAH